MEYTRRIVDGELDELFGEIPALALDGPKAVGKTTTARQRVRTVVQLDRRAEAEPVAADPSIILRPLNPFCWMSGKNCPPCGTWCGIRLMRILAAGVSYSRAVLPLNAVPRRIRAQEGSEGCGCGP